MTQPVHVQAPPPSLIGDKFLVRRKVFKLFGGAFHIYNASGQVVLYSRLKAFKLKEDIRLYTGEDMQTELLTIRARQILDIAATYDVIDATTGQRVGALRRRGLKSLIRDEWLILGPDEQEVGMIQEDSTLLALVRRFLTNLVPQKFHATVNARGVHAGPVLQSLCAETGPGFLDGPQSRAGPAARVCRGSAHVRHRGKAELAGSTPAWIRNGRGAH